MRRRGLWTALLVVGPLTQAAPAVSAGLRDVDDGWLLTVAEQQATIGGTSDRGVAAPGWSVWVRLGQMRLFGMPELPVRELGGGVGWRRVAWSWSLDLRWQRTGGGFFREEAWRLQLEAGGSWRLGVVVAGRAASFAEAPSVGWIVPALRVVLPLDGLGVTDGRLEVTASVLEPPDSAGRGGRRNLLRAVRARAPLSVAVTVDELRDGALALALDALVQMAPGLGLGLRLDPASGALGPSLVWRRGRLLLRTSHVAHPDLGLTHRFVLAAGGLEATP